MIPLQTRDRERGSPRRSPGVEVLLAEVIDRGAPPRVTIDHPDGVTLALCERVTHALPEVRERYALEVSSPGRERPLTKPDHFRRFLGRRARVRTRDAARRPQELHRRAGRRHRAPRSRSPRTPASSRSPYDDIHRSNLVEE